MHDDTAVEEMRKEITTDELLTIYILPYLEYIAYELAYIAKRQAEILAQYRNVTTPLDDLQKVLSEVHVQRRKVGRAAREAITLTSEEAAKHAYAKDALSKGGFMAWITRAEKKIQQLDAILKQRASFAEKAALKRFDRLHLRPILDNANRYEKFVMLRDGYAKRANELQEVQARFRNFVNDGASAAARIGITHYSVDVSVLPPTPPSALSKIERILGRHESHTFVFPQRESLKAFLKTGGATRVPVSDPPVLYSVRGNRPYNLHDEFSSLHNRLACQVDMYQDRYSTLQANPVTAPDKKVLDEKVKAMEIQRKKELIEAKRDKRLTTDYQKKLENLRERAQTGNGFQRFIAGCELKYQEMQKHPTASLVDALIMNATDEVCIDEIYQKTLAELINEDLLHKAKYDTWAQDLQQTLEKKCLFAAVRDELSKVLRDANALFEYGVEFECAAGNVSDEDLVAHTQALIKEFAPSITREREDLNLHIQIDRPLDPTLRLSVP
jgi:hypothetical protein